MNFAIENILYTVLAIILFVIIYGSRIFPRCSFCKKRKIKNSFKYINDVNLRLGLKGQKAVCKKCAEKHNIYSNSDIKSKSEINNRAQYKSKFL